MDPMTDGAWAEYDAAAEWCAQNGYKGRDGDPLPRKMSPAVYKEIEDHRDEFMERVRAFAYAAAMERIEPESDNDSPPEWGPRYGPHKL